jgi:hypothetical protein
MSCSTNAKKTYISAIRVSTSGLCTLANVDFIESSKDIVIEKKNAKKWRPMFVYREDSYAYTIYTACKEETQENIFRTALPYPLHIPIYFGDILVTKSSQEDNDLHPFTVLQWRQLLEKLSNSYKNDGAEESDFTNLSLGKK